MTYAAQGQVQAWGLWDALEFWEWKPQDLLKVDLRSQLSQHKDSEIMELGQSLMGPTVCTGFL